MPESRPAAEKIGEQDALRGIFAIRRSLGLGDAEVARIHANADRLGPLVDGWVDVFYTRLLTDDVASDLLRDEGRVVRLKRSLTAWFHEVFSLPYDEGYERARTAIGQTHVRIDMPPHLMVTAMGILRPEVRRSIVEEVDLDAHECELLARAMELVLDMELALMLEAYRKHQRSLERQKDRAMFAERAVRLLASAQRDRVDAALCYAELALSSERPNRKHLVELRDLLNKLGRAGMPLGRSGPIRGEPHRNVDLTTLCRLALGNVSLDVRTNVAVRVQPEDAVIRVQADLVRMALEELLQNATTHGVGHEIGVEARVAEDRITIEVHDDGPGWQPNVRHLRDVYAQGHGLGLSFCELVADLHGGAVEIFQTPGGGAGVRLELRPLPERET